VTSFLSTWILSRTASWHPESISYKKINATVKRNQLSIVSNQALLIQGELAILHNMALVLSNLRIVLTRTSLKTRCCNDADCFATKGLCWIGASLRGQ
jgi:hypothetical protein